MKSIKEASVVLESSTSPTIHEAAFHLMTLLYKDAKTTDWTSEEVDAATAFKKKFMHQLASYMDSPTLIMVYGMAALCDPR